MSTKIYDAYAIKNLSSLELKEFINELKQLVLKESVNMLLSLLSKELLEITEELTLADYFEDFERVENKILYAYNYSKGLQRSLKKITKGEKFLEDDINEVLKYFEKEKHKFILLLAKDIIARKMEDAEISKDIMNMEYDFSNDIVLFPLNRQKMLLVGFGNALPSILCKLANDKDADSISFREKYGLRDYHYQNQTDKPENVSNREWNQRKRDWEKVIPSGTYAENGIVVELLNRDMMESKLFFCSLKDHMDLFKTREQRIERYSKELARDEYYNKEIKKIENPSIHDSMGILLDFQKLVESENDEILFEISDKYEEIKDLIKDLTIETFTKNTILDFVPKFVAYKKTK